MSTGAKFVLVVFVLTMVLFVGSGVLLAAAVARAGLIHVRVESSGPDGSVDLDLPLPAGLVSLALLGARLAPDLDCDIDGVACDLDDWGPAAAAALDELAAAPDMVLVDVRDRGERVWIAKRGDALEVQVEGRGGDVEVTLPAKLLPQIAEVLD
ncbi:MAG TPA: hypothetical protein VF121_14360 [Thermoanaerobaculia bacterium]|nr:hypothetical protein [Thermoanaerobaculia bacterium]